MLRIPTVLLAAAGLAALGAGPALASATVVLTDGQVLEGADVRREGDLVTLILATGEALSLPAALVAEIRLAGEGPSRNVAPSGIRTPEAPEVLAGVPVEPVTPEEATRALGPPARFREGPIRPDWRPEDGFEGTSADGWSPSTWAASPVDPSWAPESAYDAREDVLESGRATWRKSILDPTWKPTDGFRKTPSSWIPVPSPRGRLWGVGEASTAAKAPAPSFRDPGSCAAEIALGPATEPAAEKAEVRVRRIFDGPIAALPIPLFEFETGAGAATRRGVFTLVGGSCSALAGDLEAALGLPISRDLAAGRALAAYDAALGAGIPLDLATDADRVAYAFGVVALASPETTGGSRSEILLLRTRADLETVGARAPASCALSKGKRRKALREALRSFAPPEVREGRGGALVRFETWLGAGGRVARHEVLLMPGGRVSVHTVPVSSHVGNHRD